MNHVRVRKPVRVSLRAFGKDEVLTDADLDAATWENAHGGPVILVTYGIKDFAEGLPVYLVALLHSYEAGSVWIEGHTPAADRLVAAALRTLTEGAP